MPFIRQTDTTASQPLIDAGKIFIGRKGELLFFVQNILKPEDPTHNIISVSGQGGVGKTTLLTRLIAEAHSLDFKDSCLTAIVDERQTTPVSIMEKFASMSFLAVAMCWLFSTSVLKRDSFNSRSISTFSEKGHFPLSCGIQTVYSCSHILLSENTSVAQRTK